MNVYLYESDAELCPRNISLIIRNRLEWKEHPGNRVTDREY